jgi:hypothetical protein
MRGSSGTLAVSDTVVNLGGIDREEATIEAWAPAEVESGLRSPLRFRR